MTAVQLQTEAPVVTASGQQVQTLQVVVSPPPPCVRVMTAFTAQEIACYTTVAVFHDPSMCCLVHLHFHGMSYCLNCMFLSTARLRVTLGFPPVLS